MVPQRGERLSLRLRRCGRPNQKGHYIKGALPQLMSEKGRNFTAGRRQPRYEREIDIEISGRKYSGRYVVERGLLTVYYAEYSKSTNASLPGGNLNVRSKKILRELVAEEAARGKAENSSTD
ncbi:MAG: hypothetical protein O7G13_08680 [Alphaproteobacteria bacterium]|nr:hypothetical protein [Alphaproteobacteria bacterium]